MTRGLLDTFQSEGDISLTKDGAEWLNPAVLHDGLSTLLTCE
jgi:hypothetical protein